MKIKQYLRACLSVLLVGTLQSLSPAFSSDLLYQPVNPAFGGNPNNASFLLGSANAQQQFEDEQDESSPLEEFNERLQRSLLGRITSAVTRDIVDSEGNITPGLFETVDYIIEVIDEGNGLITIITTDRISGGQTVFQSVQNQFVFHRE